MGGCWRWALVSLDGVAPSRMVSMSASVNLPLQHKVQKFSSGTGSPGWSRKNGRKTVVCVLFALVVLDLVSSVLCQRGMTSAKWRVFCPVGRKTLISQLFCVTVFVFHVTLHACELDDTCDSYVVAAVTFERFHWPWPLLIWFFSFTSQVATQTRQTDETPV